jgi:cytochrome c-type protein NapC
MEATNTLEFCISCHEMKDNVYQEYKKTIHYSNRTGVRAYCSDCHVPKDWGHKMMRKIQASQELYGKIMGTISTPRSSKPSASNWRPMSGRRMKASDSRECRNCHSFSAMDIEKQKNALPRCTRSVRRTRRPASIATRESRTETEEHAGRGRRR